MNRLLESTWMNAVVQRPPLVVIPEAEGVDLPAYQDLAAPRRTRWLFRWIALFFFLTPFALLFVPWQQTVVGRGRVVAYNPTERKATLTARVDGQIKQWHVQEGSKVKKGQLIVEIEDNDPQLAENLQLQKKQIVSQVDAAKQEWKEQKSVVEQLEKSLDASLNSARKLIDASEKVVLANKQSLVIAQARLQLEKENLPRLKELQKIGARSELEYLRAQRDFDQSEAEVKRIEIVIQQSEATVLQNQAALEQRRADGTSSIASANRTLNTIQQTLHAHERNLQMIENQIERFNARMVVAPYDATILSIEENVGQGGSYVKQSAPLVTIVPNTHDLVVELWIDGIDAPLIQKDEKGEYPHVRLQFEGWPALQFAGWPSASRGTFGGKVRQIDATDNGKGQFRIFVEPDVMFEGDEWPEQAFLRQGNQAIGWVFLNEVTLGWELWRRLNGFPPIVAPHEPGKGDKGKK
jgi:multidrug efflux pump subunit AcrA (membrane-fusion protein)